MEADLVKADINSSGITMLIPGLMTDKLPTRVYESINICEILRVQNYPYTNM